MRIQRSIVTAISIALLLTVGIGIAAGMVVLWLAGFVAQTTTAPFAWESLRIREDGLPVIERRMEGMVELRLLSGAAYTGPKEYSQIAPASMAGSADFDANPGWGSRISAMREDNYASTYWYFLVDSNSPRTAWFEAYDGRTKQKIGYLVPNGFQQHRPQPAECFPMPDRMPSTAQLMPEAGYQVAYYDASVGPAIPNFHLASQDRIYQIDLQSRQVKTVATVPGLQTLGITTSAVAEARDRLAERNAKQITWIAPTMWLVCRTADAIVLFDEQSHEPGARFEIPVELRDQTLVVTGGREPTSITVVAYQSREDGTSDTRVLWLRPEGKIERQERVSLQQQLPNSSDLARIGKLALCFPAPVAVLVDIAVLEPFELTNLGYEASYRAALRRCLIHGWPVLVAVAFLSLGLAAVVFRRHRRLALPHAAVWSVFVFLFGVPGLVGYWLHRSWAISEPCPSCKEPAPRDRDACAECGELFPLPAKKGIEVYA